MKKIRFVFLSLMTASMLLVAGCGSEASLAAGETASMNGTSNAHVASSDQMAPVEDVAEDGMTPVYGSSIKDGVYSVAVDSSSSMFNITSCQLTAEGGELTAVMEMGGKGYLRVFLGTAEEAAAAPVEDGIPYSETASGTHTFSLPVEALVLCIRCAAFSKNKEMWYDRTLVFRADSLPLEAFAGGTLTAADTLEDGNYTVSIQLEGGSGRASVESPAALRVENGMAYAAVMWSSSNYDYMRIGEEKYFPVSAEGNSTFEIPVNAFDWKLTVYANTTAMSTPHEIEYTLYFDSSTIEKAE